MFKSSRATNSLHSESQLNPRTNSDNSEHLEAFENTLNNAGRSKSINSFKIPVKAYPGNPTTSIKRPANMPNAERGLPSPDNNPSKDFPEGIQKSNYGFPVHWGHKAESVSPQKMQSSKVNTKRPILIPVEMGKTKGKADGFEAASARMNGNLHDGSSQNYLPIRPLNNYTLKPITFNKDAYKQSLANAYDLVPPYRSRKGQFSQSSSENTSFSKKNTHTEQSKGVAEFNIKNTTYTDRNEDITRSSKEELSPLKNTKSDLKLPKLEMSNLPKHRSDGNLSASISRLPGQPGNMDILHRRHPTEAVISLTDRPPRNQVRSYDKNDNSKTKALQSIVEEPRNSLDRPIVSMRKKAAERSQEVFLKSKDISQREPSPVPSRNLSISQAKSNQMISSLKEIGEKVVVNSFAVKTQAGALPGKGTKTNQDSSITHTNFAGNKEKYFFAVCDGHGANGHLVSNFIRQKLPKNVETHYKTLRDEATYAIKDMFSKSFLKTSRDLSNSNIDINFSGTTTVSLLISNSKIWSANVGDSRAILAKCSNSQWTAQALSRDHKPDEPSERDRILANGGRVESFKDAYGQPLGPSRVWLKDEDLPGLAMARSFGDGVAVLAGVISEPEVMQFELQNEDKFIVVASDGVWEFLSNQQVVDMIVPFYMRNELEQACEKVVREATAQWKEDGDIIDDITCIIISLKMISNK